jgi:hypothetical protein
MGGKPRPENQVKTAVVSYIYPAGLVFLQDFLQSIAAQSEQDFELLIFNDGVNELDRYLEDCNRTYTIFPASGTPVEIRFQSLSVLAATDFGQFIFQDIDDRMSDNRVEKSLELLGSYALVCNDLALMDEKGNIVAGTTWATRLDEGFEFDYSFISDKNIVGLGNSAVRRSLLEMPVKFHPAPLAADWFIFYQILYLSKVRAVFTAGCQTLYRQHVNNTAGLKEAGEARLKNVVEVCRMQYRGLIETGYALPDEQLPAIVTTQKLLEQNNYYYAPPVSHENLYWWEEKNYLNEKN